MKTPGDILIVEDDVRLAETLQDYLLTDGFAATIMNTSEGVIARVYRNPPDLMVIGWTLTGTGGVSICRQVRECSNLPIIMLTDKVDDIDYLLDLDIAVDDYIYKPVRPEEVVVRVKTVLQRVRPKLPQLLPNGMQLDETQYHACWRGEELALTPVEFRLLNLLHKNPRRVFPREALMNIMYTDGRHVSGRTIDSHIKNLRRKLVQVSSTENPIRSVYGIGYKLELNSAPDHAEFGDAMLSSTG